GDCIFARISKDVKLVRSGTADGSRVGRHRTKPQPEPFEDACIRVVHVAVLALEVGVISMKGVGVFHDELTGTHYPKAGSDLVAKLGLNLIEVDRQLAVAADLSAGDVGDYLLVCGAKAIVAFVPVLDLQHLWTELIPASALLPQFGWL